MIFCSDDKSTYSLVQISRSATHWRESVDCFGSPKFLHDQTFQCSNKHRGVFFCVWSRLLERKLCQFQSEHCFEKGRRLNIFWIREKMHPASDESATYAFGRSVTIRIQPPASLSLANNFMDEYLRSSAAYCDHHINEHSDNKREWLTESPFFYAHCRNIV